MLKNPKKVLKPNKPEGFKRRKKSKGSLEVIVQPATWQNFYILAHFYICHYFIYQITRSFEVL